MFEVILLGLFQQEKQLVRSEKNMKIETLKKRLNPNRQKIDVTISIPEDVIEDLKRIAPLLGFSDYKPLMKAYIGQGLRKDIERLESETVTAFINSLKRRGVSTEIIDQALSEVIHN